MREIILKAEGVKRYYYPRKGILGRVDHVRAVDGVSIEVQKGKVFSLVGESGSGKSTLARLLLRLEPPTEGKIYFRDRDIWSLKGELLKEFRRSVQVIFQDPFSSLNPRMNVYSILSEPLRIHELVRNREELTERIGELLQTVGLKVEHMYRYPHEFSGGQRQRLCIARAIALEPELIVADEPLSALDVSIQAQILNLLGELKEKKGLTFIFVSHDLKVVEYFSDYIAVMYMGKVVEEAAAEDLFRNPLHPYTRMLLDALPSFGSGHLRSRERGSIEITTRPSGGCVFHLRCPEVMEVCRREPPPLRERKGARVACFRV